jgi:major membrane immunogen (membrane-anchored lipoprotein)
MKRNILVLIVLALAIVGCGKQHTVFYQVPVSPQAVDGEITGGAVTYTDGQGGTIEEGVTLPWKSPTMTMTTGTFVSLSMEERDQAGFASVTCQIWVDGKLWKTTTAGGANGTAGCSGKIGQ